VLDVCVPHFLAVGASAAVAEVELAECAGEFENACRSAP
jgi:hypothetical protein